MKERKDIQERFKWDLSVYCASDEIFYKKLEKLRPYIKKIKQFENKLEDENMLFDCWEMEDEFSILITPLLCYASYREDENQGDSKAQELVLKIEKMLSAYNEASSYIFPEISKFSKEKLKNLQKNPKFKKFIPYLKSYIRAKDHALSKEVENLISGMGEFLGNSHEVFSKFLNADVSFEDAVDSKGKKYPLSNATFDMLMMFDDRKLRESAYKNFNGKFGENINFLASNYVASIKKRCFFAKKRKYRSALSCSIYNEEASKKVYHKLIKKVRENVDIVYEYFKLKSKELGLKDFAISDRFAKIGSQENRKVKFEEAVEEVKNAVSPLGEEYVSLVEKAVKERWIDVFPNKGKRSGAYSSCAYGCSPVVLLNFDETEHDVSTIAHELGHAIHSYFSYKNQPFQTSEYVIFVAEVASTVNEMLLWRYRMTKCKDSDEKKKMLDQLFSLVNGTIYRQTMFAEFEEKVHEMEEREEPVTKDKLCKLYLDLNKFYYGKNVVLHDEVKYEWARIPHFFTAFYVYKYATGLICALNLSKKIFDGDKEATKKYLHFLSSGSSKSPIKLLADAGANLELDKTFDEVFAWLRTQIDEWKKLK